MGTRFYTLAGSTSAPDPRSTRETGPRSTRVIPVTHNPLKVLGRYG